MKLRKSESAAYISDAVLPVVHYNNYLIFSTATFGDTVLSYGYLGQTQTTDGIRIFYGKL